MREVLIVIGCIALLIGVIMVPVGLYMSWDYRWKQSCIQQGGVNLRPAEASSSRICVRGPIEIIPIAVSPL